MRIILIAFEHKNSGYDYSKFFEKIEEYSHVKVTDTCYLITTTVSPKKIYRELRKLMTPTGDTLVVMGISKIWKGHGSSKLMGWISRNLKLTKIKKNNFLSFFK